MKNSNKIKNSLIDEFYNEAQVKVYASEEYREFKSTLNFASEKINVLNEDIFDFEIDTLSIIEQGEYIRENRRNKKEFILFILFSSIILSLCAIAVLKVGPRILIISQIIIVTITPWIIMPALVIKKRRCDV